MEKYVEKLQKEDIVEFAKKNGVILEQSETDFIYQYLKQHWKVIFYGTEEDAIEAMKTLRLETRKKALELLRFYKQKYNKFL